MKVMPLSAKRCAPAAMPVAIVMAGVMAAAAVVAAPNAVAALCDPLLNGTFSAVSDGVWAKSNDIFRDERTVTSTWTVSSSCTADTHDCGGQVISSQGWTAPLKCENAWQWSVRRHLEDWVPCPDGTTAPAEQLLYFSPDLSGVRSTDAVKTFSGWDRTVGISGGCGINQPVVIEMPFQLTRIT